MKGLSDVSGWLEPRDHTPQRQHLARRLGISALVIAAVVLSYMTNLGRNNSPRLPPYELHISHAELEYGREKCAQHSQRPFVDYDLASKRLSALSEAGKSSGRLILKNVTIIDGDGQVSAEKTVVVRDGLIERIENSSHAEQQSEAADDTIINAKGRYLTPGLIDMHSHAGVRALPQMWATEDVTEISTPVTPWSRAIDGFKSTDMGIDLIVGAGVTSSLVLTGAQNIISGEGFVFKMKTNPSPYSMLVNTSVESGGKPQRYLKSALGENIKKTWEHRPGGPVTREGTSFYFRSALEEASHLKRQQDHWCDALATSNGPRRPYPESLHLQTLVDLIRGDIRLNVHCYETEDVFSVFDHGDEFGFNVTAVHHAVSSHLMIDELKKRGVAVAGFSEEWGFKPENYDTSFYLHKALVDAGIPLALTTDHPAIDGRKLAYQAQVAHYYGVDTANAIASLLAVPARFLGLDNRIGYIRAGFDADLVIWDKHPLQLGATPLLVTINGDVVINATESLWNAHHASELNKAPPQRIQRQDDPSICRPGQKNLIVRGITADFFTENTSDVALTGLGNATATAIIRDGSLTCVGGHHCHKLAQDLISQHNFPVLDVENGFVLPGLTMVTRQYGMGEIPYEDSTMDGKNSGDNFKSPVFAKNALRFGEAHLDRAYRRGVTRLITPPLTDGVFHGVSAVFRTGASSVLDTGAVPLEECALHFTIGNEGKQTSMPSISQQLQILKELLTATNTSHSVFQKASKGELPVVVATDHKDIIAQLIKFKRSTGANIIVLGGAEAHLVANELAEIEMPVILYPGICIPLKWDQRRCLVGPPLTEIGNANALLQAGVLLGLGSQDYRERHVEDGLWETSWALGDDKPKEALDMLSRNIDKMFGLDGSKQDVVIYEGSPFNFGARVAVVLEAGAIQQCWPDVEPPPKVYRPDGWNIVRGDTRY